MCQALRPPDGMWATRRSSACQPAPSSSPRDLPRRFLASKGHTPEELDAALALVNALRTRRADGSEAGLDDSVGAQSLVSYASSYDENAPPPGPGYAMQASVQHDCVSSVFVLCSFSRILSFFLSLSFSHPSGFVFVSLAPHSW